MIIFLSNLVGYCLAIILFYNPKELSPSILIDLGVTESIKIDEDQAKKEYKLDTKNISEEFFQDFLHCMAPTSRNIAGTLFANEFFQKLLAKNFEEA